MSHQRSLLILLVDVNDSSTLFRGVNFRLPHSPAQETKTTPLILSRTQPITDNSAVVTSPADKFPCSEESSPCSLQNGLKQQNDLSVEIEKDSDFLNLKSPDISPLDVHTPLNPKESQWYSTYSLIISVSSSILCKNTFETDFYHIVHCAVPRLLAVIDLFLFPGFLTDLLDNSWLFVKNL